MALMLMSVPGVESASPELTNVRAIMALERETRVERPAGAKFTDAISDLASRPSFVVVHVVWFGVWIVLNSGRANAFDPYPYGFLTLVVSLEAIILTGFVLMSQARMTHQADRRAHLDLQINLLAEQELTAILRMVCLLAQKSGIDVETCDPRVQQLLQQTDIRQLAAEVDSEMEAVTRPSSEDAALGVTRAKLGRTADQAGPSDQSGVSGR